MHSKIVFLLAIAIAPIAAQAEAEVPGYEESVHDTASLDQVLDEARAAQELENGQVLDDYGSVSEAMENLSLQNGDVVSAPREDFVPLEDELAEEPSYDDYE